MKRTYKITNKYRFISFVTILVIICSMIIGAMFPVRAADHKAISYTEIKVQAGDTLWNIAKAFGDGSKDVREVIYDICQVNGINAGDIYPGQILRIPQ